MSLFKKIAFVLLVATGLILGLMGYLSLRNIKKPSSEVLAFMPDSCLFYAEITSLHELNVKWNQQSLMAMKWKTSIRVQQFSNVLNQLDSLRQNQSFLNELTGDVPLSFALYNSHNMQWLAVLKLKELQHEQELIAYLQGSDSNILPFLKTLGINYLIKNGMLLLSNSSALLEKAVGPGQKLNANMALKETLQGISANDVMRYYMNQLLWKNSEGSDFLIMPEFLKGQSHTASIRIQPNELVFNGNYSPINEGFTWLIKQQSPVDLLCFHQLPSKTSTFKTFAISENKTFLELCEKSGFERTRQFWNKQNKKAMYLIDKEFYENLSNSFTDFVWQGSSAFCFGVKDTLLFNAFCNTVLLKDTSVNSISYYRFPEVDFIKHAFFDAATGTMNVLFRINNQVYAAEDKGHAITLAAQITSGNLLKHDDDFMHYASEHIQTHANFIYYVAPQLNKQQLRKWIHYDLDKESQYLENLTDASLAMTSQGNDFKFRAQLNYQTPSSNGIPNLLWQCTLDSIITSQPFLFTNHLTQEREVVVCDASNRLYLINSKGEILWKKQLNESVRSEFNMVDIYKNNKYQIVFNTDHHLHMIDRNGNYVQGYPVKLPAKASNTMSLIDYEGNRDYRIFIACENNSIYNYNLFGVKAEGYSPYKTENAVKLPIKFVRVGLSDYLVTIDEFGMIHAFSRKGEGRVGFKNKAVEHCTDFTLLATNTIFNTYLVYVDEKNNLVNKVSFADKKEIVKLRDDITGHKILFEKVNDDYTPDFFAIHESAVKAFDINGNILFENAQLNLMDEMAVKKIRGRDVGLAYSQQRQTAIVLPGMKGKLVSLKASVLPGIFDLFNDERLYLVNGNESNLQCFLLK